jgi:hypothetical protein
MVATCFRSNESQAVSQRRCVCCLLTHWSLHRRENRKAFIAGEADMKTRHVFSTHDMDAAESAVMALRQAGLSDDNISLVARRDIENDQIPDDRQGTHDDFGRGGMKGMLAGGGSGLLVGLAAISVPPLGLTLAGAAAMAIAGAAVGGWVGMLTGTAEPSPVRRKFEAEIAAGHVLVVVDGDGATLAAADAALLAMGATPLPFDAPTAIS